MSDAVTRTAIQAHLLTLREQFAAGERTVQELAARRHEVEAAMLRISGAIQVLEQLLADPGTTARDVCTDDMESAAGTSAGR